MNKKLFDISVQTCQHPILDSPICSPSVSMFPHLCLVFLTITGAFLAAALQLTATEELDDDSSSTNGYDSDCNAEGVCSWAYEDAFCQGGNGTDDRRYHIHSFAVVHGQLYIFAATAGFQVPLSHPPFNVSSSFSISDLSNELPNNLYRAYRTFAYNYCSLALELDDDWEVFFLAGNTVNLPCCSRSWHTFQVIRNRRLHYQPPPGTYNIAFGAFFGNGAWKIEDSLFTVDRFISGQRVFFHVQQRVYPDNSTTYYRIQRFNQTERLNFQTQQYMVYPVDDNLDYKSTVIKEFYLETIEGLSARLQKSFIEIEQSVGDFPVVLLKNGFFYDDVMYLARFDHLEVYKLTYPMGKTNHSQIKMTWTGNLPSRKVLHCQLWDRHNYQFLFTIELGLFYLVSVLTIAVFVFTSQSSHPNGSKFIISKSGTSWHLSDDLLYSQ